MAIKGIGTNPTHHIVFTDGYTDVGFVITDNTGERNERSFRRFPRTDSSETLVKETQSDWTLGFGNEVFENNRSAYWRSQGLDLTHSGAIVLGPQHYYATGHRGADQYMPSTGVRQYPMYGAGRYRGTKFTASMSYSAKTIKFYAMYTGAPSPITIEIRNDNAGNPGTVLKSVTLARTTTSTVPPEQHMEIVKVDFGSTQSITASTVYWIVFTGAATDDNQNCWFIGGYPDASAVYTGKQSANGSTWEAYDEWFFRLTDTDDPGVAHFYEYRGQLYTVFSYDDKGASKIYMNGWRGVCDSNSGNKLRLNDSTQTGWASDAAKNCVARVIAGPATEELDDWRAITGSASGYVTCDSTWNITHSTNDDYVILGSPKWFEVTKSASLTGQVSAVAVAKGIVYYCLGSQDYVWLHREYNNAGVWTADSTSSCWAASWTKASLIQSQNDPLSGDTLWFGRNVGAYGKFKPEVWRSNPPMAWDAGRTGASTVALNNTVINDLSTTWVAGASTVEIFANPKPEIEQVINVKIGMVMTINGTPTAGGTGYTINDILTIVQTGSGLNCRVKATSVTGGVVTGVTLESAYKGWDYTTGAGKPTSGGTGTGCTVEITSISSFATGTIAYTNLAATQDIRYCDRIRYKIFSSAFMATGDMSWGLDNNAGLGSVYSIVPITTLTPNVWEEQNPIIDVADIADAKATAAIGLILNTAQAKSFTIMLTGDVTGINTYDPVEVGEDGDNLTGLDLYGDPSTLWVFLETGMGEIRNNLYNPVELRELKVARSPANGRAHTVNDVYLFFNWRGRLQRFYRQTMEDLGPDFPKEFGNVRGQVSAVQTYAGRLYVAIDGGASRRSMVLMYKGHSWHEVYTSSQGERIRSLYIQAIPGKSHRLWIGVGADLVYIPVEIDPVNIPLDSDFAYKNEGWIELSWIYTSRQDLKKIFRELLLILDNVGYTGLDKHTVTVSYKVDDETDSFEYVWTAKSGPYDERVLDTSFPSNKTRGYRIQIKLQLKTSLSSVSPVVRQITQNAYRIPKIKYGYSFLTKLSTMTVDLRGDESKILGTYNTVADALNILDSWATGLTPIFVKETSIAELKDQIVLLEPFPVNVARLIPEENLQEDLIQITINQL